MNNPEKRIKIPFSFEDSTGKRTLISGHSTGGKSKIPDKEGTGIKFGEPKSSEKEADLPALEQAYKELHDELQGNDSRGISNLRFRLTKNGILDEKSFQKEHKRITTEMGALLRKIEKLKHQ